ncbi:MAG: TonB-dependent receptor, partial [Mesoflavibacter sp.]|nr:TonB-dependent receptor [Mesoflavibacter sp.]
MRTLFLLLLILQFPNIWAQTNPQKKDTVKQKTEQLKEVIVSGNTILGSRFEVKNKTGSASYISKEELKKFSYTNINRV